MSPPPLSVRDLTVRFRVAEGLVTAVATVSFDVGARPVTERWGGTYASAPDRWRLTDAPDNATRIVIVTCGAGASTAFGIAEETIADLFD